jgi:glutathione synthase/RimK-type ligase-like ATP-grasp enzyme
MILILSNKWDLTADFVVTELQRRGHSFLRLNTEDLPESHATISLPNLRIQISKQNKVYDLARDVRVIWNRRPGNPYDEVSPEQRPSAAIERFVSDQWYTWLENLQLIPSVVWINHPQINDAMENKGRQLFLASQVGFRIPATLISNDPDAIQSRLKESSGRMVVKALYAPLIQEPQHDFFIFTNEMKEIAEEDLDSIRVSPCIFQEAFVPKVDYRVTLVREMVMPVRIESEDNSQVPLDWRTKKEGLKFVPCDLPIAIANLCRSFLKASGLLFGAIDLVEYQGNFVFLEINPNGEWGWLQKPTGLPIAEALCDLMIRSDST